MNKDPMNKDHKYAHVKLPSVLIRVAILLADSTKMEKIFA